MPSPALSFGEDDLVTHKANSEEDSWFEMLECVGVSAERIEVLRVAHRISLNPHSMTVDGCVDMLQSSEGGRLKLLSQLKAAGLTLRERQNLTNAFSRGLRAVGDGDVNLQSSIAHMILLQAAGYDAPSEAAATAAWEEQLDSDYEDAEEEAEEEEEEYVCLAEPGSTPRGVNIGIRRL